MTESFKVTVEDHPLASLGFSKKALASLEFLCDAETMRALDRHANEVLGLPGIVLMENAARSIADRLENQVLLNSPASQVVICCGKGNNGGDGFALARQLVNRGYQVMLVVAGEAKTPDAALNQRVWQHFGESIPYPSEDATRVIGNAEVLVDAIFGTGLERPVSGAYQEWVDTINANKSAIKWAVDIPSGVDSDDSRIQGVVVKCDTTVSMQFGKVGCFQYPGAAYTGRVLIPNVSIPLDWSVMHKKERFGHQGTWLTNKNFVASLMPSRPAEAHKGTFGHLINICSSVGMGGAAMLASMGALKNGAGLVTACVPSCLRDRLPGQSSEIITLSPPDCKDYFREEHAEYVLEHTRSRNAAVLGCGLGEHSQTAGFVRMLCREIELPLLIDADGLNNIDEPSLKERDAPTVITPHPKEFSLLSGLSVTEIQEARIATVRSLSREWGVVILLKGAYSVIGCPEGAVFINPTGNPGLATAGSGDVLSGFIGSFLAQGLSPLHATLAGVFLHGRAAECLLEQDPSLMLTASDLFQGIGMARLELVSSKPDKQVS